MSNVIRVDNLNFSYNEKEFIKDMSFNIEKNSYTCIVGPNGSGKTTLARLIGGLLEKQSGEIYIDDLLFNKQNSVLIRNKIGIIFQNPDNQYIGTTLKDDIIFGLENHNINPKEMDKIVDEVAELCGVNDLLEREPYAMSGGQKQKGAIAGVLAFNPSILILDEATSMLDPIAKKEFKENILKLKETRNLTIISITHDNEELLNASNIIALNKGKIMFNGTREDFFKEDVSKYNVELPKIIELEKCLKYKEFIYDEEEFLNNLRRNNNED